MTASVLSILVVDDDSLVRRSLCEALSFEGYNCHSAGSSQEALRQLKDKAFQVVISDMKMPEIDGLDLLKEIKESYPQTAVIMMTGFGSIENAVEAMRRGAMDYITKPIIDEEIKLVIKRIADERSLAEENAYLKEKLSTTTRQKCGDIIGKNFRMQKLFDLINVIADTKTTVLVTGESGTGKRMVAHAIHYSGTNPESRPFVEVSCAALPETLLESELFGHVKGAFTGAIRDRIGRFESAEGGTIFLDEIDAFTPALQVKLLRVLQDGEFERVGETRTRKAEVRIIAATNQNLQNLIHEGKFRHDLYYRLNIISLELPPLRDRKEDIPVLIDHFVQKHCQPLAKQVHQVSQEALAKLCSYHWPGNVRELENVIERACVLTKGPMIMAEDLPESVLFSNHKPEQTPEGFEADGGRLKDALRDPEKKLILEALEKNRWNKKQAAEALGINRTTLYKKMNLYGIKTKRGA